MSETLKFPEPPEKRGILGADSTARVCPTCGLTFQGSFHEDCPSTAPTLKKAPAADSSIDDIPAEAKPFATEASRQLNHYILVKQVGRGGMGAVWKAWDRNLTRWVAIKFLLAQDAAEGILRFQREAKLAARLRHPNIAAIYEVGQAATTQPGTNVLHYLAMEFIDGQSLQETRLPIRDQIDLFLKVAQGIEAAHKGGVVHRDLKPQNIMVNSEGWPYVMDFGLAKALQTDSSPSVSGAIMGTPAFMPPEQAEGRLNDIDARSDIYSLGATMYAVFCRRPAFTGQTPLEILTQVCQQAPASPRSINAEIPPDLEAVILKAMAKKSADRYTSMSEMARDLRRLISTDSSAPAVSYPPTMIAPTRAAAPAPRGKGLMIGLAALVLAACGVGAYAWRGTLAPGREETAKVEPPKPEPKAEVAKVEPKPEPVKVEPKKIPPPEPEPVKPEPAKPEPPKTPAKPPPEPAPVPVPEKPVKGLVTLKISVAPYAEIRRMTRDGKAVAFPKHETPIVMTKMETGVYTIELHNPDLGTRIVTITAREDGKVWLISGKMGEPALKVSESP